MKARVAIGAVLAALVFTGVAAAEDFRWAKTLAPGQTVEIKGVNGAVDAGPASGSEVEVTAVKHGRRSNPDSVRIEVVEHAGGVTVCAVYPGVGRRQNECRAGGDGSDSHDNDVEVHFTVKVPRGVNLSATTVNGEVHVRDLESDVEANSVNGSVEVSTTGRAVAETVNGSIEANAGRADWTGSAAFRTVNGSITVTLPASTSAEVHASSMNGDISTDFPLEARGRRKNRMSGTIGAGGRTLELQTINGSIELKSS
jgi:hypothetical protein